MAALYFYMHIKGMYWPVLQDLPAEKFNTDSLYAALFSQNIGGYQYLLFMFLLLYSDLEVLHITFCIIVMCLSAHLLAWHRKATKVLVALLVVCLVSLILYLYGFWWPLQGKHTIYKQLNYQSYPQYRFSHSK